MNKNSKFSGYLLVLIICFVIGLWVANGIILHRIPERGSFGDMFGAVNALFSGLAFTGVIYAIILQKKELSFQREELELTRSELEGQKLELRAQNEIFSTQKFDTTFFEMLRLHNDIVSSIEFMGEKKFIGRSAFKFLCDRFRHDYIRKKHEYEGKGEEERINKIYSAFYRDIQHEVGHYFRHLYNIIKFVDLSTINNKKVYTNLVRAQLFSYEQGTPIL